MKRSVNNDNRGLTLVELLIGVTILAIIVAPLLHTFVTSAGTAAKSRKYNDATDAAQNIIEQIQATDTEVFLSNSEVIQDDAKYYTKKTAESGEIYYDPVVTNPTVAPDSTEKKYYIGIYNLPTGSTVHDAMITLDAGSSLNDTDVSVSNQMDAVVGMMGADYNALSVMKSQFGSFFEDPDALTLDNISRTITMNVTKDGLFYDINIYFRYWGNVTYTDDGKTKTGVFDYTDKGASRISVPESITAGEPAFSVYLFFYAYYSDKDEITINNLSGSDFNVFLADISETSSAPVGYLAKIMFKSQYDYLTPRVFSNIDPARTEYKAFDVENPAFYKRFSTSGTLVETEKVDRKYICNISLFTPGTNFLGNPVLSLDFNKLN